MHIHDNSEEKKSAADQSQGQNGNPMALQAKTFAPPAECGGIKMPSLGGSAMPPSHWNGTKVPSLGGSAMPLQRKDIEGENLVQKKSDGLPAIGNQNGIIQGSFVSFALKMGAKQAAQGMLKNFIKTQIRGKINKVVIKKYSKRFANEASEILNILEDPWWATAIGFIPVIGDAFGLVNVPIKIRKAIKTADALEDKIKYILRIQHVRVGKLISEKFKRLSNYPQKLEHHTYAEIVQMAGSNAEAQTLKKLIEQAARLNQKI